MRIPVDHITIIRLEKLDFDFQMYAAAVFTHDDVELVEREYKTLEGDAFSLLDDGDDDSALEQWTADAIEMLTHQQHEEWSLECEQAGYEVEYPAHWLE